MEKEVLKFTPEEGREILWEDTEEFKIIHDNIFDTGRWSEHHEVVVKRLSDGKFFRVYYSCGLTELQDERPFENSEAVFMEVVPVEVTTIEFR